MNRKLLVAGLAAAIMAGSAQGATQTANLGVQIIIQNACTIAVTDPIDFGTQNEVNTTAWEDAGNVRVTCTAVAPITVTLDAGLNPVGGATDFANRQMALGANRILYTIRTAPAGGGTVIGDGVSSGSAYAFSGNSTGNSAIQDIAVYGITASGQGAKAAGTYNDTVVATVTY